MSKIKIVTDSNSGISQKEGKELGVFVIPMPFYVNGKEYYEDISLSYDQFFDFLAEDADVSTSQPSVYYLEQTFTDLLKENDELIYIPMSSGLSGTCQSATLIAEKFNNRVHVIDNQRISITQKTAVYEAVHLVNENKTIEEIIKYLLESKEIHSIYICLDTLKYLKKGGRITPAAALLGNLFKIKPILFSDGGAFEKFNTCRTFYKAKEIIMEQFEKEINGKFKEYYEKNLLTISVAHTANEQEALEFKKDLMARFPNIRCVFVDSLSLSVSCHIGPKALAAAICIDSFEATKL